MELDLDGGSSNLKTIKESCDLAKKEYNDAIEKYQEYRDKAKKAEEDLWFQQKQYELEYVSEYIDKCLEHFAKNTELDHCDYILKRSPSDDMLTLHYDDGNDVGWWLDNGKKIEHEYTRESIVQACDRYGTEVYKKIVDKLDNSEFKYGICSDIKPELIQCRYNFKVILKLERSDG